jgi:hypothetical protein
MYFYLFYLLEVDCLSSSSDEEFEEDSCSDAEATAFEPERDLFKQNYNYSIE